jgi:hypothetical protein
VNRRSHLVEKYLIEKDLNDYSWDLTHTATTKAFPPPSLYTHFASKLRFNHLHTEATSAKYNGAAEPPPCPFPHCTHAPDSLDHLFLHCPGCQSTDNPSSSPSPSFHTLRSATITDLRSLAATLRHTAKPTSLALTALLDFLTDPEIPLVCVTGIAGSGKTFITLMTALNALNSNQFERIIVTRSVQPVGKDIGFLPGDLQEKMAPWMSPLVDNFRHAFKDLSYFNMMIEKGQIEIAPLSFIRGRSFNNSFVIVDEAQNTTIHELKTIVTRVGENTKIVLMGDTDQVDTPYIDSKSNGLTIAIDKLKSSDLVSHIHLPKGERSKLATFCSKVL